MKLYELKEHLTNILNELNELDDLKDVEMVNNTYWLKNKNNYLATGRGFIDLTDPTGKGEEMGEDY